MNKYLTVYLEYLNSSDEDQRSWLQDRLKDLYKELSNEDVHIVDQLETYINSINENN